MCENHGVSSFHSNKRKLWKWTLKLPACLGVMFLNLIKNSSKIQAAKAFSLLRIHFIHFVQKSRIQPLPSTCLLAKELCAETYVLDCTLPVRFVMIETRQDKDYGGRHIGDVGVASTTRTTSREPAHTILW